MRLPPMARLSASVEQRATLTDRPESTSAELEGLFCLFPECLPTSRGMPQRMFVVRGRISIDQRKSAAEVNQELSWLLFWPQGHWQGHVVFGV